MEKLPTLHFTELTQEQKELAASIINRFGCGQHPYAEVNNIDGFTISYLKEILEKKEFKDAAVKLTEEGKKILAEIQAKLQ